jgi:hypothetical protein
MLQLDDLSRPFERGHQVAIQVATELEGHLVSSQWPHWTIELHFNDLTKQLSCNSMLFPFN